MKWVNLNIQEENSTKSRFTFTQSSMTKHTNQVRSCNIRISSKPWNLLNRKALLDWPTVSIHYMSWRNIVTQWYKFMTASFSWQKGPKDVIFRVGEVRLKPVSIDTTPHDIFYLQMHPCANQYVGYALWNMQSTYHELQLDLSYKLTKPISWCI